jgi:hypothetical protein
MAVADGLQRAAASTSTLIRFWFGGAAANCRSSRFSGMFVTKRSP